MADGTVLVNDTGAKKVDTTELTVGANTVERQRAHIGGAGAPELADVKNAPLNGSEYGLVVRSVDSIPIYAADNEVPSGAVNGTTGSDGNAVFVIAHAPIDPAAVRFYVDGMRLNPTEQFTIAGTIITILAPFIPTTGASLLADYRWAQIPNSRVPVVVIDAAGFSMPAGDSAQRSIHTTIDAAALPSGAATDATAINGTQKTQIAERSGVDLGRTIRLAAEVALVQSQDNARLALLSGRGRERLRLSHERGAR